MHKERKNYYYSFMKIFFSFLFLLFFVNIFSQENGKIVFSRLSQHWIQSEKESSGDTLVFRPEGHEKIAEAPLYLLYGGWTFFPEGQVYKYRWKKCGLDEEPSHKSGSWKKKGNTIKIKLGKEQYLFEVLELNKEMLKVRDLSQKN